MRSLWLILVLFLAACVSQKPAPLPEMAPMADLAKAELEPRRAASLRLVEQGQKDLTGSRFERAAQSFSKAIEVDPGNPYAYFYLGMARFRVSRFEEAAELFLRGANLFGDLDAWKGEALAYRGESLECSGRLEEARRSFRAALDVDASNVRAQEGEARLSE